MNIKNPNGPVGKKNSKTRSRFVRVIPAPEYERHLNDRRNDYQYDSQGWRTF